MITSVARHDLAQPFFQRFLEILPGGLVWLTFGAGIVFSIFNPFAVIVFIILFDLYWLCRVFYFVCVLLFSWQQYRRAQKTDWTARVQRHPTWRDIYHLIFLPMVNEDAAIVEHTLRALVASRYPMDRCIVVLAGEERAAEHCTRVASEMQKKFAAIFSGFLSTLHPADVPGEIRSKGANLNYAGQRAREYIDEKGIPYENVIVSAFDIDTVVHPDYFACLTDAYLSHPNPTRTSYQPVVLYNNNIWTSPAPMRLAAFSTTFWLMSELARPDRLFTFSSHSMSFRALVDVGYWQKDIVSEDSRIFLQCFMHYHGDYSVTPLYIPLSMDTVVGDTLAQSLANLYKQQRRWAWGVEHFPYMIRSFLKDPLMPLHKKIRLLWNQAEGMYTWATAPLLILVLGRLPLLFAEKGEHVSLLVQNAPFILETLLNVSMAGIFIIGFLSFFLLPSVPAARSIRRRLFMVAQWLLLPISIIAFSALPAIDAQTRLMLGRPLGFNVTQKRREE